MNKMGRKWHAGVKNSDVGLNCKVSASKGKIIAVDKEGIYCTVQNANGKVHEQLRSNVWVARPITWTLSLSDDVERVGVKK